MLYAVGYPHKLPQWKRTYLFIIRQHNIAAQQINIFMGNDIKCSYHGPFKNYWGYITELAIIDDLMIAKTQTPYRTTLVKYFIDEPSLRDHLDLLNQDRRY